MNPELLQLLSSIQARRSGIGPTSALEGLFAGRDDPSLPFGVNDDIRRSALQQAGFTGFLTQGRGGGLLDVIGATGLVGNRVRQSLSERALEASAIDTETEVVMLDNGRTLLINKQTGAIIADLGGEKVIKDKPDFLAPTTVELANGDKVLAAFDKDRGVFVDVNTGQMLVSARPVQEKARGTSQTFIGGDGREYTAFFDPTTGEQIGEARLSGVGQEEDQTEGGDLLIANQIEREVLEIDRLLRERGGKPFGLIPTKLAQNEFTRGLASQQVQLFNAAAQNVLSIIIKSRSGAQATEAEVKRLESFAIPLPGDKVATVQAKLQRMKDIVNDLRTGSDPFDRIRGGRGGIEAAGLKEGNRFSDLLPQNR